MPNIVSNWSRTWKKVWVFFWVFFFFGERQIFLGQLLSRRPIGLAQVKGEENHRQCSKAKSITDEFPGKNELHWSHRWHTITRKSREEGQKEIWGRYRWSQTWRRRRHEKWKKPQQDGWGGWVITGPGWERGGMGFLFLNREFIRTLLRWSLSLSPRTALVSASLSILHHPCSLCCS